VRAERSVAASPRERSGTEPFVSASRTSTARFRREQEPALPGQGCDRGPSQAAWCRTATTKGAVPRSSCTQNYKETRPTRSSAVLRERGPQNSRIPVGFFFFLLGARSTSDTASTTNGPIPGGAERDERQGSRRRETWKSSRRRSSWGRDGRRAEGAHAGSVSPARGDRKQSFHEETKARHHRARSSGASGPRSRVEDAQPVAMTFA